MRLKEIIRAPKSDIKIGEKWHVGKVPRADFPMARAAYGIGLSYKWNIITFRALGAECRVLVVTNERKQKYEAVLGVMSPTGQQLRILCTYEYHPSEPGWHCHATHDDSDTLTQGAMRGPWIQRVPTAGARHRPSRHHTVTIGDEREAIRLAIKRYRIEPKGTLL